MTNYFLEFCYSLEQNFNCFQHEEKEERLVEQQEEQVEDGEDIEARDADEIPHEEEEEEETRIDVTIPYCQFSLGSELYFVKMPNFLSIEHKPFDPALYEDEMEEDEVLDEEGRARLKLKVMCMLLFAKENVIPQVKV